MNWNAMGLACLAILCFFYGAAGPILLGTALSRYIFEDRAGPFVWGFCAWLVSILLLIGLITA